MPDDVTPQDQRSSKFGRRSVVRAGAWAVPAVAVVSAAPAFAACSGNADLSTSTSTSQKHTHPTYYTVVATLRATGGSTQNLTVHASTNHGSISSFSASSGWSSIGGGSLRANTQVSCNGSQVATFTIWLSTNGSSNRTVTLLFSTTNGGATYSYTFNA